MMARQGACIFLLVFCVDWINAHYYLNYTGDAAGRQLQDFKHQHPEPIGVHTTSSGEPVEVRNIISINSDLADNQYLYDLQTHVDAERIPERVVHAKGYAAFGYFEVTNDVSKYTSAEVFNGIGKKTPVAVRFSIAVPNLGGSDVGFDNRGLAVKFYSKEGNLDLLSLQVPVYLYKDCLDFSPFVRAVRRNPRTGLKDPSARWDFLTLRPSTLHAFLWIFSDYGSPDGYRKMDAFPIQTFEIHNKHGESFFVKFNFRTEQGLANLTSAQVQAINANDGDYANRDLYNAIREKRYPSWRLDMDVMTAEDVKKVNFNPFDVTVLWKKHTYHTVTIGRLVLDKTAENNFKDSEMASYNPGNLVPGIIGPRDFMIKCRKLAYKDAPNYRLGSNHNKIEVNRPRYAATYNRDGVAPVRDNMRDIPNYYPNSFSGPVPYVDESKPKRKLTVLESNAIDFGEPAYFYNHVVESDAHRQRIADNLANDILPILPNIAKRTLKMFSLIDPDLGKRVAHSLRELKIQAMNTTPRQMYEENARCFERNSKKWRH